MSPATLSANILLGFTGAGFIGKDSPVLANVVGIGAMAEIIGKPFDTTDTGASPGSGVGTGVGLTGMVAATISAQMQMQIVADLGNPPTPDMISMCDAIADAFVMETALAILVSTHSPVGIGTAIITPGSIQVDGGAVGDSIDSMGSSTGFVGKDWPTIAKSIGKALGDAFLTAQGTLIIAGAITPPPSPIVAAPNTISPAGVLA